MVGYLPDQNVQLSTTGYALAGAVSGAGARLVAQPLDVIKIRFQLQIEPIKRGKVSKYWNIRQAVLTIVKEEGITALWRGHVPAQVLSVVYGATQFVAFEFLTKTVWQQLPEEFTTTYRPVTHTVCGSLASMIAITMSHPMDLIRTRTVAQGNDKMYRSMFTAVKTIITEEGGTGLYKGFNSALFYTGIQMGLQFGLYSSLKRMWQHSINDSKENESGLASSTVCGAGSGFISKMAVYPLDVSKKRLEISGVEHIRQDFGSTRKYQGLLHCLSSVLKEEGYKGLYKGLAPSLLKSVVVTASNFVIYEQVCTIIKKYRS